MVSEFARTPALNASNGKDHNSLTNSVLLAGAGVRGGQSFGASQLITVKNSSNGDPRHSASLVDYSNGKIAFTKTEAQQENFQCIFPDNIAAMLAEIIGVSRDLGQARKIAPAVGILPCQ